MMAGNRKHLIYFALIGIVVLLNLPLPARLRAGMSVREGSAPFLNVMSWISFRLQDTWKIFFDAADAVNEKETLLAEVAELRLRVREAAAFARENDELRSLLQFKTRQRRKLVLAEVISRGDATGWWQTITINRGTEDGIGPNMPVMTVDGLVGRTREGAGRHSCDVILITEPTLRVACRMSSGGVYGIMRGGGAKGVTGADMEMLSSANPGELEYLDKTADINTGEEVVTSGLGGVFPEGLRVGYVRKVAMDESGLFKRVQVKPAAKLGELRYVFVILN